MLSTQILDALPVGGVFIVFAVIAMAGYEAGFRLGRWWQNREPGEQEGPTGVLVGSILALLAFLLAVTMGMASDRFDARRQIVLDEANAIGTTYLRAGYLPDTASSEIRELLREYVPLRIRLTGSPDPQADIARSQTILNRLWAIAEGVAKTTNQGDLVSTFIEFAQRHDRPERDPHHGAKRACPGDPGPAPLCRLGVDADDGRIQCRPDETPESPERGRPDHRPGRGAHDRHRPRPAAGGPDPGEPATAHRPAAADRTALGRCADAGAIGPPAPRARLRRLPRRDPNRALAGDGRCDSGVVRSPAPVSACRSERAAMDRNGDGHGRVPRCGLYGCRRRGRCGARNRSDRPGRPGCAAGRDAEHKSEPRARPCRRLCRAHRDGAPRGALPWRWGCRWSPSLPLLR